MIQIKWKHKNTVVAR